MKAFLFIDSYFAIRLISYVVSVQFDIESRVVFCEPV